MFADCGEPEETDHLSTNHCFTSSCLPTQNIENKGKTNEIITFTNQTVNSDRRRKTRGGSGETKIGVAYGGGS